MQKLDNIGGGYRPNTIPTANPLLGRVEFTGPPTNRNQPANYPPVQFNTDPRKPALNTLIFDDPANNRRAPMTQSLPQYQTLGPKLGLNTPNTDYYLNQTHGSTNGRFEASLAPVQTRQPEYATPTKQLNLHRNSDTPNTAPHGRHVNPLAMKFGDFQEKGNFNVQNGPSNPQPNFALQQQYGQNTAAGNRFNAVEMYNQTNGVPTRSKPTLSLKNLEVETAGQVGYSPKIKKEPIAAGFTQSVLSNSVLQNQEKSNPSGLVQKPVRPILKLHGKKERKNFNVKFNSEAQVYEVESYKFYNVDMGKEAKKNMRLENQSDCSLI